MLASCSLCPRRCGVNRLTGELGVCRVGCDAVVSSYGPHFGEERPLVGAHGSGTVFFTGCNLRCIFCQNYDISQLRSGDVVTTDRLAQMMIELQERGCHNINLVTPTHQVPQILEALVKAAQLGLCLPIVYNCGGYESLEALRLLDGIVDIYMPDMKYGNNEIGSRLSGAPDYWDRSREAVREMHRQVGDLRIVENESGGERYEIAIRGLLVRHLVLPGGIAGTAEIVEFLANEISKDTYINIMDQYRPAFKAVGHELVGRRITSLEYEEAMKLARTAGLWRFAA
jgi:putative pyruvate formate lyase activating enzyme